LLLGLSLLIGDLLVFLLLVAYETIGGGGLRGSSTAKELLIDPLADLVEAILVEVVGFFVAHDHAVESLVRVLVLDYLVIKIFISLVFALRGHDLLSLIRKGIRIRLRHWWWLYPLMVALVDSLDTFYVLHSPSALLVHCQII
jgi:hypothetical protein